MNKKTALVVTSISKPNEALQSFADGCRSNSIDFFVVGDRKSPAKFSLDGCNFLSLLHQKQLKYKFASLVPENHYSRKNIGYLTAIEKDNNVIIETDDDNYPYETFWNIRDKNQSVREVQIKGWYNAYSAFTQDNIWPRGFPLEQINTDHQSNIVYLQKQTNSPIHQGLANNNPDVDAVFRLTMQLPVMFDDNDDVALPEGAWCPFNSQNTTWYKEAFPLLYLPSYCSFRMTDIWRSFIAQRIAWTCNWMVLFHKPTVFQERNEHSLISDFKNEIPGYLHNSDICNKLNELGLNSGMSNISDNLIKCYKAFIELGHIDKEELALLDAWLEDISSI